jgi:hypothetical protein
MTDKNEVKSTIEMSGNNKYKLLGINLQKNRQYVVKYHFIRRYSKRQNCYVLTLGFKLAHFTSPSGTNVEVHSHSPD